MRLTYNQTYTAGQYNGMPPARIIFAMYEGALVAIDRASEAIAADDIARRGEAVGKALSIVSELQAALNLETGLPLAEALFALYDYINRELLRANVDADMGALQTCACLIGQLKEAWEEMMVDAAVSEAEVQPQQAGGYL